MIHPSAIIHPKAKLDSSVRVGPYAVIDEGVELGNGCVVGAYVCLTGRTIAGSDNEFYAGCVIGERPQDLKWAAEASGLRIGDGNVFREHVTVHRSSKRGGETTIGSKNFFMAACHVGHDCRIGNSVILTNGALLGGHAVVEDRAFLSGHAAVHQFTRVGELSMSQGGAIATKDVPPFTLLRRVNELCGLNVVGLRRAGISPEERLELKTLYRRLFREGMNLGRAVEMAKKEFSSSSSSRMIQFIEASKRGVCSDPGRRSKNIEEED